MLAISSCTHLIRLIVSTFGHYCYATNTIYCSLSSNTTARLDSIVMLQIQCTVPWAVTHQHSKKVKEFFIFSQQTVFPLKLQMSADGFQAFKLQLCAGFKLDVTGAWDLSAIRFYTRGLSLKYSNVHFTGFAS